MKKLLLLLLLAFPFALGSCSSDGDKVDDDEDPIIEQPKSIVGVWENDNYILSFNSNGFYCAYLADKFIDSGIYNEFKDVVSCENTYFNRKTIYTIKGISDTKLNVDISYKDIFGNSQNITMVFTKTTVTPASQSNALVGKVYKSLSSTFGNITMAFNTYNSGLKTATKGSAAKYPLSFFYIYVGGKLYHQILDDKSIQVPTIGSWSTDYYTVKCWKLSFDSNGGIGGIEIIQ